MENLIFFVSQTGLYVYDNGIFKEIETSTNYENNWLQIWQTIDRYNIKMETNEKYPGKFGFFVENKKLYRPLQSNDIVFI